MKPQRCPSRPRLSLGLCPFCPCPCRGLVTNELKLPFPSIEKQVGAEWRTKTHDCFVRAFLTTVRPFLSVICRRRAGRCLRVELVRREAKRLLRGSLGFLTVTGAPKAAKRSFKESPPSSELRPKSRQVHGTVFDVKNQKDKPLGSIRFMVHADSQNGFRFPDQQVSSYPPFSVLTKSLAF